MIAGLATFGGVCTTRRASSPRPSLETLRKDVPSSWGARGAAAWLGCAGFIFFGASGTAFLGASGRAFAFTLLEGSGAALSSSGVAFGAAAAWPSVTTDEPVAAVGLEGAALATVDFRFGTLPAAATFGRHAVAVPLARRFAAGAAVATRGGAH